MHVNVSSFGILQENLMAKNFVWHDTLAKCVSLFLNISFRQSKPSGVSHFSCNTSQIAMKHSKVGWGVGGVGWLPSIFQAT